jgi:hypothetical protein
VIGLPAFDGGPQSGGFQLDAVVNLCQRLMAVNLRLPLAKAVEVWTTQHQNPEHV